MRRWHIATPEKSAHIIDGDDPVRVLARWCANEGVRAAYVLKMVDTGTGTNRLREGLGIPTLGPDAEEMFATHFKETNDVHFPRLSARSLAALREIEEKGLIVSDVPRYDTCAHFFRVTKAGRAYPCERRIAMSFRLID